MYPLLQNPAQIRRCLQGASTTYAVQFQVSHCPGGNPCVCMCVRARGPKRAAGGGGGVHAASDPPQRQLWPSAINQWQKDQEEGTCTDS